MNAPRTPRIAPVGQTPTGLWAGMVLAVALANVLMPIELMPYLSAGTPIIAVTFLINEVAHRRFGPATARRIVWRGFAAALALSAALAPIRIAGASAAAFLCSQLLDIAIFRRLRHGRWWLGPLCASLTASAIDTLIFFLLAFSFTDTVWWRFAYADLGVKCALDLLLLLPFRMAMARGPDQPPANRRPRSQAFGAASVVS